MSGALGNSGLNSVLLDRSECRRVVCTDGRQSATRQSGISLLFAKRILSYEHFRQTFARQTFTSTMGKRRYPGAYSGRNKHRVVHRRSYCISISAFATHYSHRNRRMDLPMVNLVNNTQLNMSSKPAVHGDHVVSAIMILFSFVLLIVMMLLS